MLRSSSWGCHDYCEMKYFIQYNLGQEDTTNIKAEKGTVVHKVLEVLALIKMDIDGPNNGWVEDEALGKVQYNKDNLYKEFLLTHKQIQFFNKIQSHNTYKTKQNLKYGHKRTGQWEINRLIDASYKYYSEHSSHTWGFYDKQDCINWTWMALEHNDGEFSPLKRKVFAPEQHFNVPIDRDWAKLEDGSYVRVKGTIDLIYEIDDVTLEVCDWKTGQRKNWATDEIKTHKKLCSDAQLSLYYFALSNLYPDKDIILNIFFIRDGGPFPVVFDKSDLPEIENRLKTKIQEIQSCKIPKLRSPDRSDKQCSWCSFRETLCPLLEEKFAAGTSMEDIEKEHTKEGFTLGYYQAPGDVSKEKEEE